MKKLISTLLACVFLWQAMPLNVIAEAVNPFPTAQELSAAFPTTRRATTAAWPPITA